MNTLDRWVVGTLLAAVGLISLFVASRAEDPNIEWIALVITIACIIAVYSQIGRSKNT